jgi:thiosulfate dehydrogenase
MPYGVTYNTPEVTEEEAWDVAAFISSQPRPVKFFSYDWKDIKKKPLDYPFGPYADGLSEQRHKFGPFKDMLNVK